MQKRVMVDDMLTPKNILKRKLVIWEDAVTDTPIGHLASPEDKSSLWWNTGELSDPPTLAELQDMLCPQTPAQIV